MSKCGVRGKVHVCAAVPLYRLYVKGKKYLYEFLNCLNNVKKIAHGLCYSLRHGKEIVYFLQTCRQSSDPQGVQRSKICHLCLHQSDNLFNEI